MIKANDPNYHLLCYAHNLARLAEKFAAFYGFEIRMSESAAHFMDAERVAYEMPYVMGGGTTQHYQLDYAFNSYLKNGLWLIDSVRDLPSNEAYGSEKNLEMARIKLGFAHQIIFWSLFEFNFSQDTRFLPFISSVYEQACSNTNPQIGQMITYMNGIMAMTEVSGFPLMQGYPNTMNADSLQHFFNVVDAYRPHLTQPIQDAAKLAHDAIQEMRKQRAKIDHSESVIVDAVQGLQSALVRA